MIIVRVELWPGGDPRSLRQIELLSIVNVGPDADGRHSYEARHDGRIARLRHDRADGALALVARAIESLAEGSEADPRDGFDDVVAELEPCVTTSAGQRSRSRDLKP